MDNHLHQMTALGSATPITKDIGHYRIVERFDVALASIAARSGQEKAFAAAGKKTKVPFPEPTHYVAGAPYNAFHVATDMWFIEAPFTTHSDIVGKLKPLFGEAASITEQTDAWVRFDISGQALGELFARLSNLDFAALPDGYASRTVIDHLGCYLIKHGAHMTTLYGPRSSAESLLHALEVTAKSLS